MGDTARIQHVIDYIDAHLRDDISIAALADIAECSPWHLYRMFKDCTGRPLMEYIRWHRLHSAVDELAQGRRLYDIAMDYGFETQAGFYKAFQRHFGCSPTRYRIHKLRQVNPEVYSVVLRLAGKGGKMEDRLVIRVVQESDADDLWGNIFIMNTLDEVKERIAEKLQRYADNQGLPLVAEVDGHVVGTTTMGFNHPPLWKHICKLGDVVVNPAFQGRGIARRLIEECKAFAIEKGKGMIILSAVAGAPAETVYRKLGFIEYGRLPNGLVDRDEVMFYMPLKENP